jgi:hypothetical protein
VLVVLPLGLRLVERQERGINARGAVRLGRFLRRDAKPPFASRKLRVADLPPAAPSPETLASRGSASSEP